MGRVSYCTQADFNHYQHMICRQHQYFLEDIVFFDSNLIFYANVFSNIAFNVISSQVWFLYKVARVNFVFCIS